MKDQGDKLVPASLAQRRLWFLDEFTSGSSAYNVSATLRLHGPLDVKALRQSLTDIVERHEVLRTTFDVVDGEPYQRIAPPRPAELAIVDLPAQDREAAAIAAAEAEIAREFSLAHGPLFRATLAELAPDDHVLTVLCHHSVCDGWSMGTIFTELSTLYAGYTEGYPVHLDPLPLQFGDHAVQEREQLADPGLRRSLDHWISTLAGAPALLELPSNRARPAVQGFEADSVVTRLDGDTWQAAQQISRSHNATLYMVLLAAYAALLGRLSATEDVVVGTPSAGRARPELKPLVGMFVNTLPLRVDLSGDPTYAELLRRVRRTTLAALTHQHVPLEMVVNELCLDRATSHDPLFQTVLALELPLATPEMSGLTVEMLPTRQHTTFTDLWLDIRAAGDGATALFRYRTELFEADDVQRIADQFRLVLAAALADPQARVSQLPLLTAEDRTRILDQWGHGGDAPVWDGPVQDLIRRQAEATPEATAVVFEGVRTSYAELLRRADGISQCLLARGIGPGDVITIGLPRGVDLVASILGVLGAGAAYLPLSTEDSANRLALLTRQVNSPLVITNSEHAHRFDAFPAIRTDDLPLPGSPRPLPLVGPDDLAYVIYTSGSTGLPKPVAVPHKGFSNRLADLRRTQGLGPADRVLQKTPHTFDVSVWELLWPLTVGASLVVAAPGGHRDPAYLVDLIEREAVTTVHFVPPMLEAFLHEPGLRRCASLRRVLCSGQALPPDLRDRCLELLPTARLHNFYGPTEASIEVTTWECTADDRTVPIGRPIPGVEVYVLDRELNPVPVNVPGELHLGGIALARGYLGRPDLTADRFVPHPYGTGSRLYRTGDLVRWRADGVLEFLGRNDHQLKVRGFRIEPGEVQGALRRHAMVRDAVVTGGEAGLIAHVAPIVDVDPREFAAELKEFARTWLPEYMVPGQIVVVPEFALTASGKIDVRALPEAPPDRAEGRQAPQDEVELALAGIWGEILGYQEIGVGENFFDLGGDSLKSIRVVHRARAAGIDLSVSDVFHHPTVQELATLTRKRTVQQGDRPHVRG